MFLTKMTSNLSKKPIRSNSTSNSSTIINLLNQNTSQLTLPGESNEFVPVFFSEISDIMRGFGDGPEPQRESVILIEKILLQQLRGILQDAVDCAMERRGKACPTQIDFEYLMRKHPVKISRLRKHLLDVKFQKKYEDLSHGRVTSDLFMKNQENSDEESIDDDLELYDAEKSRRIFRADRISQTLNGENYVQYNIARRVSFNCRNSITMRVKLRNWLNIPLDISLSTQALTIMAYLAHETIATIVDYCILTRLNSANRFTEPYARVTTPGTYFDILHLCPEVTQGRGCDGAKTITTQEINEAMRRFSQSATQKMGKYRNAKPVTSCYLAL